jgi:hypothetical protein
LGSAQVARRLRVTQRSVNRWKAMPEFQIELRRLHEMLAAAVDAALPRVAHSEAPASSMPHPDPRSVRMESIAPDPFESDAREDREMDALIESLIGPDPALPLLARQSNLRRQVE